jgi:hypothetical protein
MKPLTIEMVAKSIVGWIYDFKADHGRFPGSLEDLAENKADKHSYNPKRAIQLNQKLGFETDYRLLNDQTFEITICGGGKGASYSSASGAYTEGVRT